MAHLIDGWVLVSGELLAAAHRKFHGEFLVFEKLSFVQGISVYNRQGIKL